MRLTHLLIAIFSVLFIGAVLFPVYTASRPVALRASCLLNVKQQGLGLVVYATDSDGQFPIRDAWMDAIHPYGKAESIFKDPEGSKGGYGYAFNATLSEAKTARLKKPDTIPMVYDSANPIRNASDPFTSIPSHGKHPAKQPEFNNIAYADGHSKSKRMTP